MGSSSVVVPSEKYLQTKRKSVFNRPYEQISQMDDFVPPVYEKSPEQIKKLIDILKNNFLTKNISQFELKLLADAMQLKFFKRNDMIIRYGDVGNEYFILDKGVIEIQVYRSGADPNDPELPKKLDFSKFITTACGFGEIALLYNDKRTASVRAADECMIWAIEGRVFKHIIIKSAIQRRNIELKFIE